MRILVALLANLLTAVRLLVFLPLRLLVAARRPPYVRFRLKGNLPYRTPKKARGLFRKPDAPDEVKSIEAFRRDLELCANDPKVKGALLFFDGLYVSAEKRTALAEVLEAFRARGREVVAYGVSLSGIEYAVAASASRIFLSPPGRLELTGVAAEATALKGGLHKAGIRAHFVRRGAHKTAPELFTDDEPSEIQRRTLEGFLDANFDELVRVIAEGRKLPPDEVRRLIDEGPYSGPRALAAKLVDGLHFERDLPTVLLPKTEKDAKAEAKAKAANEEVEEPSANKLSAPAGRFRAAKLLPEKAFRPLRRKNLVGVIPLAGMIVPGEGGGGPFMPTVAGHEAVLSALSEAEDDGRTKAVVLYIDSPGGSALASELILDGVRRLAKKKPVVAYVDRVCASGGYMAAVGANEIWASPTSVVGSIGVFAGKFEAGGLLQKLGIHREVHTRGKSAGLFSTSRPFTPEERERLEADVEETYQAFLREVAAGRNLSVEEVHARGEGRVFTGKAAKEQKLVDQLGRFEGAVVRAFALSKSEGGYDVAVYAPPKKGPKLLQLLSAAAAGGLWALWWEGAGLPGGRDEP